MIKGFKNVKEKGEGAHSKVFSGTNIKTGVRMAVKKYNNDEHNDAKRERRYLSELCHENIVRVYFELCNSSRIVMELLPTTLISIVRHKHKYSQEQIRRIVRDISEGLRFCHLKNIVHRDIKLENILIDKHGKAKIADFGLATRCDLQRIVNHDVVTLGYRAPELLLGKHFHGKEIDVWAFGCVVKDLMTWTLHISKHVKVITEILWCMDLQCWFNSMKRVKFIKCLPKYDNYKETIEAYKPPTAMPKLGEAETKLLGSIFLFDYTKRATMQDVAVSDYLNYKPNQKRRKIK